MNRHQRVLSGVGVVLVGFLLSCGDDPAQPVAKGKSLVDSLDYTWIDIRITGYPEGSVVVLRPNHWSTAELTADPEATVRETSKNVFRLSFSNLGAGSFVGASAKIRLVVQDSVVEELSGIVVLCDATGPLDLSNCQGDCDPLCGIDDCHGCNGNTC